MKQHEFIDAKTMSILHSETFEEPSWEDLNTIEPGSIVKVCAYGERFWVTVTDVNGDKITGTVDNDLLTDQLHLGDVVEFEKKHIYNIYDE